MGDRERRILFGKYRGELLEDLPDGYLEWLAHLADLREPLRTWVAEEYEARFQPEPPPPQRTVPLTASEHEAARAIINTGYRAMARMSHPDSGGTNAAMQAVNAAMAWLRKQVEG